MSTTGTCSHVHVCRHCESNVFQSPAPADYTSMSQQLTFSATNTQVEVTIPISDDNIDENLEHFLGRLTLLASDVTVQLSPQEVQVQIIDNNGKWFNICMYISMTQYVSTYVFPPLSFSLSHTHTHTHSLSLSLSLSLPLPPHRGINRIRRNIIHNH